MANTDPLGALLRKVRELEEKNEFYERKTFGCADCARHKKRIDEVEAFNLDLCVENGHLKERIAELEDTVDSLNTEVISLEDLVDTV